VPYERRLISRLIDGLQTIPSVRIYGITDPKRFDQRCSTLSLRIADHHPKSIVKFLGERGIFTRDGNYYALNLTERLGVESKGVVELTALPVSGQAFLPRRWVCVRLLTSSPRGVLSA
jgi:selenocysteine lyase/cysteine desulfurase